MARSVALMFLYLFPLPVLAEGEGSLRMPKELEHAEIIDKAGAQLPLDVKMINQDGQELKLGDYFSENDTRPVILTLGYYGCPMLCSLVLNGLTEVLRDIKYKPGQDFRIVSVSIDERENADLAKKKQRAYLASIGGRLDADWWQFNVMDGASSRRLADSVGFDFAYDKKTDQFAHGAGFFVLTPKGILSRTLYGISFKSSDITLALGEASDGKIGSFIDRIILSCFHYNPDSHRYGIYIMGVMRLGGIVTVLVVGIVLLMYFRAERRRIDKVIG